MSDITSNDNKVTIELNDGRSMEVHVVGSTSIENSAILKVKSQLDSDQEIWVPLSSIKMIRGGQMLHA